MLRKLLKYDLKSMGNTLFPIYGITIGLAVLARIFIELNDVTAIFKLPMGLVTGLAILATIAVPFIAFIIGIDKFNKQITKDEGYLTHTLPVEKHVIIGSKLMTQTLFQILSLMVLFISICIIGNVSLHQIGDLIQSVFKIFSEYTVLTSALVLSLIFTGYMAITLLVYAAISFGQKHSSNKGKFAILYGVLLYIAQQIITSIVYTPLLMDETFIDELDKELPDVGILNITLTISLLVLVLVVVAYFVITTKNLKKKLNLE